MSSVTTQQAKLDLKLVPREKRLEIGKCNERLNPRKTQREPTFQVVQDALALTLCYFAFLTTTDVPESRDEGNKADKIYLGYAIGITPPKKARKFKKLASSKLTTVPVLPEEPTRKSKRVKRPTKKFTNSPTAGVVIRDTPMTSLSKKKEKMTVEKCKGFKLLSESEAESWGRDEDDNNNDSISKGSDQESDSEENEEEVEDDEEEKEGESVKTPSNYTSTDDEDETNVEPKVEDKAKGDEDKGMDYTTNQFDDDVDIRLNEPINTNEGFIQKEVHVSVITESSHIYTTVIPESLASFTPPPQSTPMPPPTTKATNPLSALLNFTPVFQFSNRVSALEKEVIKLKNDYLLNTQVTALVDEHLYSRNKATRDEFISYLSASITARITEQVKIQLPRILTKEVSNFYPPMIKSMVIESLEHVSVHAKEPKFEVADSDMPQDQEENQGPTFKLLKGTRTKFSDLEYDFEKCYKALSEKLDWDNPEGGDYPFDLTKHLPLVINGNHQIQTYSGSDSGRGIRKHGLTNLSGNDVLDFAIALRMFSKRMVIQKRVKDLQLGVESYQKKINITKPETTRPGIRKRDPYTPYQDPKGFIMLTTK
nr:hypothetical protein [Tanacetum cinerariifolium]